MTLVTLTYADPTQTTADAAPEHLPESSNQDATSSLPTKSGYCTSTQCRRELASERHLHEQQRTGFVPRRPGLPTRNLVALTNIDEDRPLVSSENLVSRELLFQSREAVRESSFHQHAMRSIYSVSSGNETEGILPLPPLYLLKAVVRLRFTHMNKYERYYGPGRECAQQL